jgi:hemerythrin-like domain-containing protein
MTAKGPQGAIEPIPLDLLREPLVWFFAEHYRRRDLCERLLRLAPSAAFEAGALEDVRRFLDADFPAHIADEENDLFPLLRRRCQADDQIETVLEMLAGDHANDLRDASAVSALLARAARDRRGLGGYLETAALVQSFCRSQKRHIAVENAVVLPIARLRLTREDLHDLGRRLAARRGLGDPFARAP